MNYDLIAQKIKEFAGLENVRQNEPMKGHTSFKVGGNADILVSPWDTEILRKIIKTCVSDNIPYYVFGNGTNLIVRDKGIRGVVIKLLDNFNKYTIVDDVIEAQAGVMLSKISKTAFNHQLSGLEFAEGIPGTLGGAVVMNAGAYGGEMKDVVIRTEFLDKHGDIVLVEGEQHQFGYRTSFIQKEKGIVLRSWLKFKKGNSTDIKNLMEDFSKRRKEKQPLEMPSAGSVFKRPEGHFTGRLIEDCGLKGYRIGGAEVSCKHCGFIVNADNAAAKDVIELIDLIQKQVKSRFNVELQTEVRIVGEE